VNKIIRIEEVHNGSSFLDQDESIDFEG